MTYPNSAVTVAVLLVFAQAASAYVVPEVVLMRVKRNPEPMRSFSYSGFNPNGQMAAFTGLAEFPSPYANYGPPMSQVSPYRYGSSSSELSGAQDLSYGPPPQATAPESSYGPPPSGAITGNQFPKQEPGTKLEVPYDSSEQTGNSAEQPLTDNNKKHTKSRDGSSSNAEASFNAWFPIMFGVFPNGAGSGQSSGNGAGRGGNYNQGQGQDQGNSYNGNNGYERSSGGTTVIANSVSNGKHGVATSHAIAYGNPRSSSQK